MRSNNEPIFTILIGPMALINQDLKAALAIPDPVLELVSLFVTFSPKGYYSTFFTTELKKAKNLEVEIVTRVQINIQRRYCPIRPKKKKRIFV